MKSSDIDYIKNLSTERIEQSPDRDIIYRLLGIIETAITEISELKEEVQSLRNEINQLKGEKGKPNIRRNRGKSDDYSSEENRKSAEKSISKGRNPRNFKVQITREEICKIPAEILPPDAIFKGYSAVIVQDLKICADNIKFQIEKYYSPSTKKTYSGSRPQGFEGEYGPGIKSLIIGLKYCCNVSEPAIEEFLTHHGIFISKSTISRYLTQNLGAFHDEKEEIIKSGLRSTIYQQLDDTGARVNGKQWFTQILCNLYYTSYHTIPHKDRLSILRLLIGSQPLQFLFNEEAFNLLKIFKVSNEIVAYFKRNCYEMTFDEDIINEYLTQLPTRSKSKDVIIRRIKEAAAIAWYHNQRSWPIIDILLTDDAPQFDHIANHHALCWIHAGRSLKKLNPLNPVFQNIVHKKLTEFWEFYHLLAKFKKVPDKDLISILEQRFDEIFCVTTYYQALDDRIRTICLNKDKLLQVLWNPVIPLHNNESELGARVQVRKRDVSLHTITIDGTKALDTFLSLKETTRKCGINFFEYLFDRITRAGCIERLGKTILHKAGIDSESDPFRCNCSSKMSLTA